MSSTPQSSPIGIFDSGLGGLTVLKSLISLLPHENFVYLGDTARLPYGSKSKDTIKKYLSQNILAFKNFNVKAVVVACNSASTVVDLDAPNDIPLFEVITPGATNAIIASTNGHIGVLGTRTTVESEAYLKALKKINSGVTVYQQACPLFVPLVEEGWVDDPLTNLIVLRYLTELKKYPIDTLILGCTHYPALKHVIQKVMGSHVQLIDSAESIAKMLRDSAAVPLKNDKKKGELTLLSTDYHTNYIKTAEKLLGFEPQADFIKVDL